MIVSDFVHRPQKLAEVIFLKDCENCSLRHVKHGVDDVDHAIGGLLLDLHHLGVVKVYSLNTNK